MDGWVDRVIGGVIGVVAWVGWVGGVVKRCSDVVAGGGWRMAGGRILVSAASDLFRPLLRRCLKRWAVLLFLQRGTERAEGREQPVHGRWHQVEHEEDPHHDEEEHQQRCCLGLDDLRVVAWYVQVKCMNGGILAQH